VKLGLFGECLFYLLRYDEGLAQLKKTSEMDLLFPTEYQLRLINIDPSVDALRNYPRFKELARRMKLDSSARETQTQR
jgi:hypothetical protein